MIAWIEGPLSIVFTCLYERIKNCSFCSSLSDLATEAIHGLLECHVKADDPAFWEVLKILRNEDATSLLQAKRGAILTDLHVCVKNAHLDSKILKKQHPLGQKLNWTCLSP